MFPDQTHPFLGQVRPQKMARTNRHVRTAELQVRTIHEVGHPQEFGVLVFEPAPQKTFDRGLVRRTLTDYETIVRLIAKTTTATGLQVICTLDRRKYAVGKTISDAEMNAIRIVKDKFHGEWNYTISPALNTHL